jgi:hypothetical protein
MEPLPVSQAQFERNMIELIKASRLNEGSLQTTTWKTGDYKEIRNPPKRKVGTAAATPGAHGTGKPTRHGRKHQPPNLDASIAAVSVKKERIE